MSARSVRLALYALAAFWIFKFGEAFAAEAWFRSIASEPWDVRTRSIEVVRYLRTGTSCVGVAILASLTLSTPRATRARAAFAWAVGVQGLAVAIGLGSKFLLDALPFGAFEAVGRSLGYLHLAVALAASAFFALGLLRLGRAVGAPLGGGLAFAGLGLRVARDALYLAVGAERYARSYALPARVLDGLAVALLVAGAIVVALRTVRLPEEPLVVRTAGEADPAWTRVGRGFELYLGATGFRFLLALGNVLLLQGAKGAQSISDLRGVRDAFIITGGLSVAAGVAIVVAVARMADAPRAAGAWRAATWARDLGLGVVLLDLGSTALAAAALDGDLGAAFFAADAVPFLAALTCGLGAGFAGSLATAWRRMAEALGLHAIADQAGQAFSFLVFALAAAAGTALLLKILPAEFLLVVLLVLLVPLLVGVVQFLRTAFGLAGHLRTLRPAEP